MPTRLLWVSLREKVRAARAVFRVCLLRRAAPIACFAPNNFTNAVTTLGTPHFFSQYLPIDFILNNQFKTPWARLPLNVLGEFIVNPEAKSHPLGSTGAIRADLGSQNKAYQIDSASDSRRTRTTSCGLRMEPH